MLNLGLLVMRLIFGLSFARHGTEKLFGWFGGYGIKGTAGYFESIGVKPGVPMVILAGLGELLGGLFLAAGILLPVAAVLIVGSMLVAIAKATGKNGFAITAGGYEYNLAIIAVAIGILLTGPGAYVLF
ncbi:DoxX family protein [Desulfitobacterium metallireducens]|uniref:Oxidoreductase n=1 Tax=Desulfitobacterium metallireducens DSM 15288 TaxID=871968 RepID=W0E9C5_9FIRM|nr:DoxX family protein [Desulfitobacterium metallireducens]AHF06128.1 oxidoreductase [Desulfitobacterium metallireducens DSM 15288]